MTDARSLLDRAIKPLAWALEHNDKSLIGANNTMALARRYNRLRYGRDQAERERACRESLAALLAENAAAQGEGTVDTGVKLQDGWVVDASQTLPHMERMLREANEVIDRRTGTQWEIFARPFLQNLLPQEWLTQYPALLDFATSSAVLGPLARYAGFIPQLSGWHPRGVRIMESSNRYDPAPPGSLRNSQMLHRDFHAVPLLYVIVALRDIGEESGPFVWAGIEASDRVARQVVDGARGNPHWYPDVRIRGFFKEEEFHRFTVRAGTVLFIDSSRCFHYGSRNPVVPRYHLQLAYVPACRTDFTEPLEPHVRYPLRLGDSRLRRMVLAV